jgi:hypothetical protein
MRACERSGLTVKALALLVLQLAVTAWHGLAAAQGGPPEAMLGGVEAVLFVCGPLDVKTSKDGTEMQTRLVQQFKLDLNTVRKAPGYTSAYNAEVNRLLLLSPARKLDACKNVF